MLALARRSIADAVSGFGTPEIPELEVPQKIRAPRGCFVTLTEACQLRGCIGNIFANEPLFRSIIQNAQGAALRDSRFPPVQPLELHLLQVEISVLTEPRPLTFGSAEELLALLRPGVDGVLLRIGSQYATFLPQVWTHISTKEEFLDRLSQKAGFERSAWREANPLVSVYQAESFAEGEELTH